MRKLNNFRNFWFNVLVCFLLASFGQLRAQLAINRVEAENQVHFANNTNFEIGTLTIKIKLPPAKNTAEVTVTLPTGIEYVAGSVSGGVRLTPKWLLPLSVSLLRLLPMLWLVETLPIR